MHICEKCKLNFVNSAGINSHSPNCNLSPDDVIDIKVDYIKNNLSIRDIKKKYNISAGIIYRIVGSENMRTISESISIVRKNNPRKTSNES